MDITNNTRAGVDIGSQFIRIAYLDHDYKLLSYRYDRHNNDPLGYLTNNLDRKINRIAFTGTDEDFIKDSLNINSLNLIKCLVRQLGKNNSNILFFGHHLF